jgi:hypothetical protein
VPYNAKTLHEAKLYRREQYDRILRPFGEKLGLNMAFGCVDDEIILQNQRSPGSLSREDRIIGVLEDVFQSEAFGNAQDAFADKCCHFFDQKNDASPQCKTIHDDYVKLIEKYCMERVRAVDPSFTFDQLASLIQNLKGSEHLESGDVFEILNAVFDFGEFQSFMASYNSGRGVTLDVTTTKLNK